MAKCKEKDKMEKNLDELKEMLGMNTDTLERTVKNQKKMVDNFKEMQKQLKLMWKMLEKSMNAEMEKQEKPDYVG